MRPDPIRSGGLTKEIILHHLRESYPQLAKPLAHPLGNFRKTLVAQNRFRKRFQ
jgi:hypothetical protein